MLRCLVCVENIPNQEKDPDIELAVDDETISLCSSFCIALKLNFSRYRSQLYKTVFCVECKRRLKQVPSILNIPNSIEEDDEISNKIKQIMLDGYLAQMDREIDNSSNQNHKEFDCPFQSTRLEILKELGLVVELDDDPNIIPVTSSYNSKLPLYIDLELDEEIPPEELFLQEEEKEGEKQINNKETVIVDVIDGTEKEEEEKEKELNNSSGIQNEEERKEQEEVVNESIEESSEIISNIQTHESKIQSSRPHLPKGIVFVPQPRAVSLIAAEKIKNVFATSSTNKMKDKSGTNLLSSSSSSPTPTLVIQKISSKTVTNKKTKHNIQVLGINGRKIKIKKSSKKSYIRTKKNIKTNHSLGKSSKENKKIISTSPGDNEMPALSAPYLEDSELDSSEVDTRINEEDDNQIEMPQLDVEIENVTNKKNKRKLKKLAPSENSSSKKKSKHGEVLLNAETNHTKKIKNTKSLKKSKYHNKNSKLPIEYRSCSVVVENFSIEQIAEAASRNNVKIPSIIIESSKVNANDKSTSKKRLVSPVKAKEQQKQRTTTTTKEESSLSTSPSSQTTSTATVIGENLSVHVPNNLLVCSAPNIMSSVEQPKTSTITQPMVHDNVISSSSSTTSSSVMNSTTTTTINTAKSSTDSSANSNNLINNVSTVVNSSIPHGTIKFCTTNQNTLTNTNYASNRKSKRKPLKPTKGICASTLLPSQQESQQQKLQGDNTHHHQSMLSKLPEQNSQNPMQQMEMQVNAKSQNETSNDKSIIDVHVPSLPQCVQVKSMTASTTTSATYCSITPTTTTSNNNGDKQVAQIQLTNANSNINGASLVVHREEEKQSTFSSTTSRISKIVDDNNLKVNCIPSENKEIQTRKVSNKNELHQNQRFNNSSSSIRTSPRKTYSPSKKMNSNINTSNDTNNNEVNDKESTTSSSPTPTTELKSNQTKPKGPPYLPLKISVSEIEKVTAVPQKIPLLKRKIFHSQGIQLGPSIIQLEDATRAVSAVVNNFRHVQKNDNSNNSNEQFQNVPGNVSTASSSSSPFKSFQNSTETVQPKIPKLRINIHNMTTNSGNSTDVGTVYRIKGNGSVFHDNNNSDSLLSNNHDSDDLSNVDADKNEDDRMSEISDSELGFLQEETNRFKFGLRPRRETIMKIKTALESDSESDKSIKSKDSDNTESDPMFSDRYRRKKKLKATNTLNKLSKLYGSVQSTNYGIIIKKNKHYRHERKKKQQQEEQNLNGSKESSYSCDKCQSHFSKKSKLKSHLKQHEKDSKKKFQCEICGKGFHYAAKLMLHKKLHSEQKEFQCDLCPRSFTSKQYLDIHTRNHPPPSNELNRFPCDQCPVSFCHLSTLREHQRSHSGQLPFQCDICNQRFPFLSRLKRHQSVKHQSSKPYACRFCGIAFKQAGNLKCHEKRHDEKNKKFQCPYSNCSQRFFDQNKLKQHIAVHSGEKKKIYSCDQCSKIFRLSSSLKTHVCTANVKKKSYTCQICHKKFSQKQYLNYHQKTHPKFQLPRYVCPEDGCGRSFSEASNLREHALKHTGIYPFQCELCDYKVAFRSRLVKHMLRHTTEKKFACEICHKKFALESYKTRHVKNVHLKNKDKVEDYESVDEEEEEEDDNVQETEDGQ